MKIFFCGAVRPSVVSLLFLTTPVVFDFSYLPLVIFSFHTLSSTFFRGALYISTRVGSRPCLLSYVIDASQRITGIGLGTVDPVLLLFVSLFKQRG
ncbi:hypothetical protein F4775DRAFT_288060 [Biscogniauxia sp. FL1348]|nr:hypothetical protein F4775DRAFT_288060 [Biscogniauxia sp. FL1348]